MMREFYGDEIVDPTNTKTIFSTNKGYAGLFAPMNKTEDGKFVPNFRYRYLVEDIPNGLCVLKGIAMLVNVKTPCIDKIILWAQKHLKKHYLNEDGSVGPDFDKTHAPQATHIMDLTGSSDLNTLFSHL